MPTSYPSLASYRLSREERMREAVLLSFCEPLPVECMRLRHLSSSDWRRLLTWLDTSGLALYFLHRLMELHLCNLLPAEVLSRLQRNLTDNTARIASMMQEQGAIQRGFQAGEIQYAVLKGFSLWPSSLPRPELRSQLDLDFLIAERCAPEAQRILEARGYHLQAISGRSWELKTDEVYAATLDRLYKDVPYRAAELHLEGSVAEHLSLLARTERRSIGGVCTPVLSAPDLFLGQGLHVFKHICSEFSRTAHLIEWRRHVLARHGDLSFWKEVRSLAEESPRAPIALGVITLLITQVMGDFAPEALTSWTSDMLPQNLRLWVELYGRRAVFMGPPGNKLYMLLQKELEGRGIPRKRSVRRALLPLSLPPAIAPAIAGESISRRFQRYRNQSHFVWLRLRFHVVEGLRYFLESSRWQQYKDRLGSSSD